MHRNEFSQDQHAFLRKIVPGRLATEITVLFNQKFGLDVTPEVIRSWKQNHHVTSGIDTTFKKGYIPPNKGKHVQVDNRSKETQFKNGNIPSNTLPVGTIVKRTDGYLWQKIRDDVPSRQCWKQYAHIVWQTAYGPLPAKHKLIFLDGNRSNCSLDNLALISNAAHARMAHNHYFSTDPELTKLGIANAELITKSSKAKRKLKGKT